MVKKLALVTGLAGLMSLSTGAHAAQLVTTVTASSSSYTGSLSVLNDNVVPALGTFYCDPSAVCNFGSTTFRFDFGGLKTVTDVLASVDNNDDYSIQFFNGATSVISFFIPAGAGSVAVFPGGLDSFASFAAGGGATQLGTSSLFQADSAVISGSGGDGLFGIGEVDFFDNSPAVPEPATWAMMVLGFGVVGGAMRRRQKVSVSFA